jgi:hypothetical protein
MVSRQVVRLPVSSVADVREVIFVTQSSKEEMVGLLYYHDVRLRTHVIRSSCMTFGRGRSLRRSTTAMLTGWMAWLQAGAQRTVVIEKWNGYNGYRYYWAIQTLKVAYIEHHHHDH